MKQLLFLLLFPTFLYSQSEGGFGFRRYSDLTSLNNTTVNNSDKSASRRAYVNATGLYYRWNGSAWVNELNIDTFSVSTNTLSLSIRNDGQPAKTVTIDPSVSNEGLLSVSAIHPANSGVVTSNTTGSNSITFTGGGGVTVTSSSGSSLITISAEGVGIVDTVRTIDSLRIYDKNAVLVFVKESPQIGWFIRLDNTVTDDGGILIHGTNDWGRYAEDLSQVNIKWFGAVGDSITNDNTAIQATLSYCLNNPGTILYFPAGKYSYTSTISAYKPIDFSIKGDGMSNTYLFATNCEGINIRTDSTVFIIDSKYGLLEARDFEIKDLSVFAAGTPITRPIGIDIGGGYNIKLENVRVEEFFNASGYGVGIRLYNPIPGDSDAVQHTILDNVYVMECDTGITTRLHNTMLWHAVEVDQCNKVGVVLRNGVYWTKGMVQGSQNCGIWIDENPYLVKGVHLERIHFEGNAYSAPKYGTIYKPSSSNTTEISVKDCYLSSPGSTKLFNLNRVLGGEFMHNTYAGGTTDTISLTSVKNVNWGRDNYTALKLITSDCNITWFGGVSSTEESLSGLTVNSNTPNVNAGSFGGGIVTGTTYVTSATAPTNGASFEGNVNIGTTTSAQTLTVSGTARITGSSGTATTINGRNASGDLSAISVGTGISLSSNVLSMIGGISPDSSWAKTSGGYANKRITDALYRAASIRINMVADSAAVTLKLPSTFDNPVFKVETNNGSTAFILHYYNSSNPSLILGGLPSISSSSANNTVFGLTNPTFTAGAGQNTFVGRRAGNACNGCYENTLIGSSAGSAIIGGYQNTFIGYLSGSATTTGYQNMFLGRRAGLTNISGQNNVYVGSDAGRLSTGSGNVFVGGQAGDQNTGSTSTMLGYGAGRTNTGSNNVFVGYSAGELTSGSNRLMIDNSNTSTPLISGNFTNDYVGINTHVDSLSRTLMVGGTARITSSVGTATTLMGRNSNGDISSPTLNGLSFSSGTITANSIYTANGSTFSGGPNVTVNGNTIRLYASTFNANPIMKKRLLSGSLGYFDRWIANNDSLEISYITNGFFLNTVGGNFGIISTEQMNLQADSILVSTLESVPALKYAVGINSSGVLKKIVGTTDGDVLGWDGTSNHWEVRPKTDYTGGGSGTNIYNSDGTTTDNTRNVTVTETLNIIGTADYDDPYPFQVHVTGNEPVIQLWKGNTDSVWIKQSDVEYYFKSSAGLVIGSNEYLYLAADSILATTVATKTKIQNIVGISNGGTLQQIEGTSGGQVLTWNASGYWELGTGGGAVADGDYGDITVSSSGTVWSIDAGSGGIYEGSGNVPDNTVATVASNGDFRFAYNGSNPAFAVDDALNQTYISGKSGTYSVYADNSNSGLVSGTATWLVGSDYALTATASVANTNTVADRLIIKTNSTGTAASNFGGAILFQGESSTTDNRDMARLSTVWTTATDASREAKLSFQLGDNAGALTEIANFNTSSSSTGALVLGSSNAVTLTVSSLTPSQNFIFGNNSNTSTFGGSNGITILSSTGSAANTIQINPTSSSATSTGGISIAGSNTYNQTSGTRNLMDFAFGFAPTSGTAVNNALVFSGAINQTGGANGIVRALYDNRTITAAADYRSFEISVNSSSAKGIYQTGGNTKNSFVGATGFGSTTAPTDKVEVTGNLALLSAGNKLKIATGSNASVGTGTLSSGTATINTTAVSASSLIFVQYTSCSSCGTTSIGTITAGTSFVVNSSNGSDSSTFNWWLIN